MNEEEKRKKAIELYQSGEKVNKICQQLGKSRKWFYKWKKRFIGNSLGQWYKDESKAPLHHPKKRSEQTERQIMEIRKKLEANKYSQTGATSIRYEFFRQGKQAPAIWTINRVLKAHGLVKKKSPGYQSKNLPYPGKNYISVHQMDFVGPRYIKDFGRVYSLNIIDIETHHAHINPLIGKNVKYIIPSVIRFWKEYGLPDYLQMDNELSFRGSNIHPKSPGKLIRFALSQGVGVIFIPVSEPWRNGIIENFNDTFDKYFYRKNVFTDLEDMKKKPLNLNHSTIKTTGIQPTIAGRRLSKESSWVRLLNWMGNINYQKKSLWTRARSCLSGSSEAILRSKSLEKFLKLRKNLCTVMSSVLLSFQKANSLSKEIISLNMFFTFSYPMSEKSVTYVVL
jgi:transposase-like protein/transposase InsO family protein